MEQYSQSATRIRPIHYRSIFISDVHLGFTGCSAGFLLDFLRSTTCDTLYLVGDIIDICQMKKTALLAAVVQRRHPDDPGQGQARHPRYICSR